MSAEYDQDNIFAKILRGDIPSNKVHEDDDVLVIMDVMPQADGHALVIPKAASRNMLDADPGVLEKAIKVTQTVGRAAMKAFDADGLSIMQFNEAPGGQSVFHLHFHVIPRYDGVALRGHGGEMEDETVLAENADMLRTALADQ